MFYKLSVFFDKKYNFKTFDIQNFFEHLKEFFTILSEDYIFFNNNINFKEFNPNIINCFIEYTIEYNEKNIDLALANFFKAYTFVEKYNLQKFKYSLRSDKKFYINPKQIDNLVSNIDKLFYIRSDLADMSKYIKENQRKKYLALIKNLSVTKYNLKNESFLLRMLDLNSEIPEIESNLLEYAKNLGIAFQCSFITNNLKIDKLVFAKIKEPLLALLRSFINEERKWQHKNIQKQIFKISIEFIQDFSKLKIIITCPTIKRNKDLIYLNQDKYIDPNLSDNAFSFVNYIQATQAQNGRVFIDEDYNLVTKLRLKFFSLLCYIIQTDLGYFAIDLSKVIKISKFNIANLIKTDNISYYKINNLELPILNKLDQAQFVLQICVKKQNFILLAKRILYKEKIFVRHINDMSGDFIGDCLLKDTKKAYILNLAKYLESRTNE